MIFIQKELEYSFISTEIFLMFVIIYFLLNSLFTLQKYSIFFLCLISQVIIEVLLIINY